MWIGPDGKVHHYGLPLVHAVMRADTAFGKSTRLLQTCDDRPGEPENTGNPWGRDFCGRTYTTCHRSMHDMVCTLETEKKYTFSVRNIREIDQEKPHNE